MSRLRDTLSQTWLNIQSSLFPWLLEELGPLTEKQQELVTTLEVVRIEEFLYSSRGFPGRPPQDRTAIARAFVAKMIYNMPTTRALPYDGFAAGSVKTMSPMNGHFRGHLPSSRNRAYLSEFMKLLSKKAMKAK